MPTSIYNQPTHLPVVRTVRRLRQGLIALLAIISINFSVAAQEPVRRPGTGSDTSGKSTAGIKSDSVKPKKQSSAWTISTPLGNHSKASVDTLLYNYQRKFIPSLTSDAYATTGTLGSEGVNMIYFDRAASYSTFFFNDALSATLPSLKTMKFYNVYVPMTLLSYNFGGGSQNHADRLQAIFAGNVNRNIGIGGFLDYNYAKGAYNYQALKDFNFGFTFYFNSHRYEGQALYFHFTTVNKENGGITDYQYITDPAEVQGGVNKIEPKSIPTNLTMAHTRLRGDHLFTTHALKLGYWTEEAVNDTTVRDVYIPVTKFVYSLDYERSHHEFTNTASGDTDKFWAHTYLNPNTTNDDTEYWSVTNSLGVQLLEGFRKWAKFGIEAFASLQTRRITQTTYNYNPELSEEDKALLTPLPEGFTIVPRITQTRLSAGATISKRRGSLLTYAATAKFGITGGIAGDIDITGNVGSRFRLFGDTVSITASGGFHNASNSYFLGHYISNHFAWNQTIGKTTRFEFGGKLTIPWTKTEFSADFRDLKNMVYFNTEGIPTQHAPHVQVFALRLNQKLKFGIWNWNNTITYQVSSDQSVLPLPALAVYSNMFLDFRLFKVLNINLGIDCDYYTRYHGYAYQPATMVFHVQDQKTVGNYAFCNAYLSAKLYKARFYILYSHVNQGWFGNNYFSVPYYPLNPRNLQFGVSIDFAN